MDSLVELRASAARKGFLVGGLFVLCFGLNACAIVGGGDVSDLKLISVMLVDQKDQDIEWLGGPPPSMPVFKIEFSSKADFLGYILTYEYNVSNLMTTCNAGHTDNSMGLMASPHVYGERGLVDWSHAQMQKDKHDTTITERKYHLYLYPHEDRYYEFPDAKTIAYDLFQKPQDVCFIVRGGNMIGGSFTSNTVIIPKETLTNAMSKTKLLSK